MCLPLRHSTPEKKRGKERRRFMDEEKSAGGRADRDCSIMVAALRQSIPTLTADTSKKVIERSGACEDNPEKLRVTSAFFPPN